MKKQKLHNDRPVFMLHDESRFEYNIENMKRHRALGPGGEAQHFFDRLLNVKKVRELVFITKANAKSRG